MFGWLNSDSREALRALRICEALAELTQHEGESVEVYSDRIRVCAEYTSWMARTYHSFSLYEAVTQALREKRTHTRSIK